MLLFDAGEIDFTKLYRKKHIIDYDISLSMSSINIEFMNTLELDFDGIRNLVLYKPKRLSDAKRFISNIELINYEGFTSIVYKIVLKNGEVALKVPKKENDRSFWGEIETRKRFLNKGLSYYSKTIYIPPDYSYILSEWLPGTYIKDFGFLSCEFYFKLLKRMVVLEIEGAFCWDLNLRNIKYNSKKHGGKLYDYGDLYLVRENNLVGFLDNISKYFSNIERVQNCHILRHLARLERSKHCSVVIQNYKNYLIALYFALIYREKSLRELDIKDERLVHNIESKKTLENILFGKTKISFENIYKIDKFICYLTTIEDSIANEINDESFFLRVSEMLLLIQKEKKILDQYYYLYNASKKMNLSILQERLWTIIEQRAE